MIEPDAQAYGLAPQVHLNWGTVQKLAIRRSRGDTRHIHVYQNKRRVRKERESEGTERYIECYILNPKLRPTAVGTPAYGRRQLSRQDT